MKTKSFNSWALVPFIALIGSLLSFSPPKGGEGFEVYLNNEVIIQKFGKNLNDAASFDLSKANGDDEIKIRYYHCTGVGKERHITIKDAQEKTLKVWNVVNSENNQSIISFKVKELLGLPGSGNNTLKLYYSSSELPSGRLLASLQRSK